MPSAIFQIECKVNFVNPNNLVANRISSQEVADARIEYRGRGATDDTQGVGWFTRILLKMAPF